MAELEKMRGPRLYSRPLRRKRALGIVHEAIELCRFYIYYSDTVPRDKRQWIKTMNGLISTSNNVLKDLDLDNIKERITILEEFHLEKGVDK